ncbi:hypothetical protein BJ875DRAFT_50601 [Amylocarpus encephaloides]|uniref:Uncharacterized protein n=1 Tax=Amylocarpus encephaloides TaxID=45428 RepID=A0A9P8C5R4_9HELO|nr:hypothetical protein BJ875DRAFT_50601 [Amylocarpus encephaloides]
MVVFEKRRVFLECLVQKGRSLMLIQTQTSGDGEAFIHHVRRSRIGRSGMISCTLFDLSTQGDHILSSGLHPPAFFFEPTDNASLQVCRCNPSRPNSKCDDFPVGPPLLRSTTLQAWKTASLATQNDLCFGDPALSRQLEPDFDRVQGQDWYGQSMPGFIAYGWSFCVLSAYVDGDLFQSRYGQSIHGLRILDGGATFTSAITGQ